MQWKGASWRSVAHKHTLGTPGKAFSRDYGKGAIEDGCMLASNEYKKLYRPEGKPCTFPGNQLDIHMPLLAILACAVLGRRINKGLLFGLLPVNGV